MEIIIQPQGASLAVSSCEAFNCVVDGAGCVFDGNGCALDLPLPCIMDK